MQLQQILIRTEQEQVLKIARETHAKVTNLIEVLLQLLICKIDAKLLKTIQKEPCQLQDHILQ